MKYLFLLACLIVSTQVCAQSNPRAPTPPTHSGYTYQGPPITRTLPHPQLQRPARNCYRVLVNSDKWGLPVYTYRCY